jgi:hypothetical protein
MKVTSGWRATVRISSACLAVFAFAFAGMPADLARANGVCSPGLALNPASIHAGQSTTLSVFYECLNQPPETVTISVSGLPTGAKFSPATTTSNLQTLQGSVITITTLTSTKAGKFKITVGGKGGAICGSYSPCDMGTLTVEEVPVISCASESKVCLSIWWFNGVAQPANYVTTLQATSGGTDYKWTITNGGTYAQFTNGMTTIDTGKTDTP